MAPGRLPAFGAQFSNGRNDPCLREGGHDWILWCGSQFMPTDLGMKTKKKKLSRNLRPRHSAHPCFRPKTKVYVCLGEGEQAVFLGGTGPKKYFSGTGPVILIWSTIFAWMAHFSLRRHKQLLVGHAPKCPPVAPVTGWA